VASSPAAATPDSASSGGAGFFWQPASASPAAAAEPLSPLPDNLSFAAGSAEKPRSPVAARARRPLRPSPPPASGSAPAFVFRAASSAAAAASSPPFAFSTLPTTFAPGAPSSSGARKQSLASRGRLPEPRAAPPTTADSLQFGTLRISTPPPPLLPPPPPPPPPPPLQPSADDLSREAGLTYRRGGYGHALALYCAALEAAEATWGDRSDELAVLLCNAAAARMMARADCAASHREALDGCLRALALSGGRYRRARLRAAELRLKLGIFWEEAAEEGEVAERAAALSRLLAASLASLAAAGVPRFWPLGQAELPATAGGAEAALEALDGLLREAPFCVRAHRGRFEALLLLRRLSAAAAALARAVHVAEGEEEAEAADGGDWWPAWASARLRIAEEGDGEALEALEALQQPAAAAELLAALRAARAAKEAGNAHFAAKRFAQAAESYGAGLAPRPPPPPHAAACLAPALATLLSNRAAALHALGWRLEAAADCGAAVALVPGHARALSRRAELHGELGLSSEALQDLTALHASPRAGDAYPPAALAPRLAAARAAVAAQALEGRHAGSAGSAPLRLEAYKALGVAGGSACAPADVRRAYRRAALRLHPDKAIAALPAGLATGIEVALREDAERLFRLASDASDALGSEEARRRYDAAVGARDALRRAQEAGRAWSGPGGVGSPFGARGGYAPRTSPFYGGGYSSAYSGGYSRGYPTYTEDSEDEQEEAFFYSYARTGRRR